MTVPIAVLLGAIGIGYLMGGWHDALLVAVLSIFEVALSFNNAVINASVLGRMNRFWQTMFLTLGLLIAVVGMRILFPILIVMVTAHLPASSVVDLALNNPQEYANRLAAAHASISAFGGTFLLMLFFDFVLDESKQVHWFKFIERPLARAGRLKTLSTLLTLLGLWLVSATLAGDESGKVLLAGAAGMITYLLIRGFSQVFESIGGVSKNGTSAGRDVVRATGWLALGLFVYLEVLDAAFSFDGVVGAFAITDNVVTIALGLGVGALFVRELTVWLVRRETLKEFIYLEHGAQYSVGALAVLLAFGLKYDIPHAVTGVVGAGFIILALVASLMVNRRAKVA